jgi:hypothetical protein
MVVVLVLLLRVMRGRSSTGLQQQQQLEVAVTMQLVVSAVLGRVMVSAQAAVEAGGVRVQCVLLRRHLQVAGTAVVQQMQVLLLLWLWL